MKTAVQKIRRQIRIKEIRWTVRTRTVHLIGIDWKADSLDKGDHLNLSGACKVTAYLGKYLDESEWKLTNHGGDAALSAWEKEAEEFEQKVAEKLKAMREK